jgi:hypothetical protein
MTKGYCRQGTRHRVPARRYGELKATGPNSIRLVAENRVCSAKYSPRFAITTTAAAGSAALDDLGVCGLDGSRSQ